MNKNYEILVNEEVIFYLIHTFQDSHILVTTHPEILKNNSNDIFHLLGESHTGLDVYKEITKESFNYIITNFKYRLIK